MGKIYRHLRKCHFCICELGFCQRSGSFWQWLDYNVKYINQVTTPHVCACCNIGHSMVSVYVIVVFGRLDFVREVIRSGRGWITMYRISTRLPRHIFMLAVTLDLDIHCFLCVSFLCLGVGILSEEWFLLSWLDYNVTHYQVTTCLYLLSHWTLTSNALCLCHYVCWEFEVCQSSYSCCRGQFI